MAPTKRARTILHRQRHDRDRARRRRPRRHREVFGDELTAAEAVTRIIADVRSEGDAAVRRYCEAFDGRVATTPSKCRPTRSRQLSAAIDPELREALEFAAGRVRDLPRGPAHAACLAVLPRRRGLGVQVRAIETVGFYAPGTAPVYPSSVLHTIVPAIVAGVENARPRQPGRPATAASRP